MGNSKAVCTVLLCFFSMLVLGQQRFSVSGTITDARTGETLIGASVFVAETNQSTAANEYGFYSLSLPEGTHTIRVSFIGFADNVQTIDIASNTRLNIGLEAEGEQLQEVVVSTNDVSRALRRPEMSVNRLSVAQIKNTPVVLGEVDVLKTLLQLPGVTSAGEGAAGFNVRGGAADQNLILLDEAVIYNASHLFGFFSVFNADAIKDIKLYKGGIPARFGGRLSSVLEIYQKEGNSNDFSMTGGIGLISSRLMAEGPIEKGRASYLVAGRASYAHLFLKLADNDNSAYFYDLNTKLSYRINDRNHLYLSGYFGRDVFSISESFENTYGNAVLNLRWNQLLSDKLFANLSLIYSDYDYGLTLDFVGFKWNSGIRNYHFKYDFKHYVSEKWRLAYGANAIYYDFNPGDITPSRPDSGINADALPHKYAFEPAVYLEAENELTEKLSLHYGLRYSRFFRLGSQTVNLYANDRAVVFDPTLQLYEKATPIGTRTYKSGEPIADFGNLEPRFAVAYSIDEKQSVKASYNRLAQYLHQISNTASPTPLDNWAPSDDYLKPQILDQVAVGYFRNFSQDRYTLETEVFYKKIKNRLDYIDGADLIANEFIEQVLLPGRSRAYGLEMLLRKNTGKLTGWVAYTLSRAEQQTPGFTASEPGINNGDWYLANYDKTHNIAVTASYEWNPKWRLGANFVFQSGQAVTFPDGQYEYQGIVVPTYGARNRDRLAAFHHLDLAATYVPKPEKKQGWQSEWVFSIYNVYGRKNAASVTFRQNEDTGRNESVRLSIFGIVPSVTYNFKF